jgi:putative colanic acid biosynthesis acetyltransferase WcaF
MTSAVDAVPASSPHPLGNRLARALWSAVWLVLFRPSPKPLHAWRRWLLRSFGARIGRGAVVHPSCRIWAPWNLEMGNYSCLAFDVDCYTVDKIVLGEHAVVSQYAYLCTATHDYKDVSMPLVTAPVAIGAKAWVAARAFVGPGVTIGEGAVVGAATSVFKDVPPWTVVQGNPGKPIKQRTLRRPAE